MSTTLRHARVVSALACLALATTACNSDDVTAPPQPAAGEFTVDASQGWVYVSLVDSAVVTPTPTPSESAAWDIAFFATNVMLNGGEAGPGNVTGFCVCQNTSASDDQVLAMTPESELADYEGVTAVPGTATFLAEVLTPAVAGWFTGTAPAVATAGNTYVMRLADGSSYAKLRFTSIANSTANNAGQVTLEFAVQGSGATSFGGAQLLTVDLSTGAKSIDLNSGQVTTSDTDWDLRLEGYTIRVNGGASGSGAAGAFLSTTAFDDIAGATAPAIAYAADTFAGVFGPYKWYRYNILGDNRISPVFEVYLVRRGDTVWKLQVLNYYSATNAARHISFRYERISD